MFVSCILVTVQWAELIPQHPTSVNFRKRAAQFEANYLTYFTIMQSKRLYAWEVAPVADKALAVLCGDIVDLKVSTAPTCNSCRWDPRCIIPGRQRADDVSPLLAPW